MTKVLAIFGGIMVADRYPDIFALSFVLLILVILIVINRDVMLWVVISAASLVAWDLVAELIMLPMIVDTDILDAFMDEPTLVNKSSIIGPLIGMLLLKASVVTLGGTAFGLSRSSRWSVAIFLALVYQLTIFAINFDVLDAMQYSKVSWLIASLPYVAVYAVGARIGMWVGRRFRPLQTAA